MDGPRWQFKLGRENGLAFWGMVFLEASFGSYFALWPLYIEELGASVGLVGWLLGLGGILRLFVLVPSAGFVRRWGVKPVLLACRSIATLGIFWAVFAQEWWWLFPTLAAMAIGEMAFPLLSTHVADNAGTNRVRAFAVVMTIGPSISLMATPVLSGGLVELWGLRAPFVASALFSLAALNFYARFAPGRRAVGNQDDDAPPTGYRDILRVPGLPRLMTMQFITFLGLGIGTSLLSIYLHDVAGYSEARIAVLTALTAVGSITFAAVVTRSTWLHEHPLKAVSITCGLAMLGYVLFLLPELLPLVLLGLVLRGGFFAAWPLFSAVLGEAAPPALRPHAYALGEILAGTGFVCAPVLAGLLYGVAPRLPLIVSIAMLIPMVIILGRIQPPRNTEPSGEVG